MFAFIFYIIFFYEREQLFVNDNAKQKAIKWRIENICS